MKVSVTYAEQQLQFWQQLELEEDATVADAITQSGILQKVPSIDLDNQKVGIFGKAVKLDRKLVDGERVEIYQPITADPDTVERRF